MEFLPDSGHAVPSEFSSSEFAGHSVPAVRQKLHLSSCSDFSGRALIARLHVGTHSREDAVADLVPVELLRNLGQQLASVLGVERLRVGEHLVELGVGEGEAEVTFRSPSPARFWVVLNRG